jgi:hypothetical protein
MDKFYSRFSSLAGYRPNFLNTINEDNFLTEAANYFRIEKKQVQGYFDEYKAFSQEKKYAETLGETKTLSQEEAFLLVLCCQMVQPDIVVEIGTQYGKSTRRILDLLQYLQIHAQVVCFDLIDEIKFVSHDEISLHLHDLTMDFHQVVLSQFKPSIIYLDAHPFHLLKNVLRQYLDWSVEQPCILAIHDCSKGLYKKRMHISPEEPSIITSRTGLWERHVLAEVFHSTQAEIDNLETSTHTLRIFDTQHGLAVISPNFLWMR